MRFDKIYELIEVTCLFSICATLSLELTHGFIPSAWRRHHCRCC